MSDHPTLGKRAPQQPPAAPRRFHNWLAGPPADTTLSRDIPAPLSPVLKHWITLACQHDDQVAQRVGLRLGIMPKQGARGQFDFVEALRGIKATNERLDPATASHPCPSPVAASSA